MSNILEYTLTLQDKLSAKLRTIGVNSDAALNKFSDLQKKAVSVNTETKALGNSLYTLKNRIDLLQQERDLIPARNLVAIRTYNSEIKKLEGQMRRLQTINGGPIKTMFKDALSNIPFSNLLTNPLVAAGALAAGSFKIGFQNDMAGVAFETLLGDPKKSKALVDQIRNYANVTPYQNMPLQENVKMMLGFGIAQEKIMPNLKMLGDLAMGDANKMNLLTLAFSQISSAGKLQGQDLLQLINAGFNPLQEISKNTGKSMAVLRKEMEKGNISFDMVNQAFISATSSGGRFYNMTKKMGESPMGKWSTFIDSLQNILLKVYDVLRPLFIPALNLMTKAIGWLQKGIQWVIYRFQRMGELFQEGNPWIIAITGVLAAFTAVMIAHSIYTGIITGLTWLWTSAQTALNSAFLLNPVTWIVISILALIAVIGYVAYKTEGWGKLWGGVTAFLHMKWIAFKEGFLVAWLEVQDSFLKGVELIQRAWYKVQGLWDKKGAAAGLSSLTDESAKRAKEIADHKKSIAAFNTTGEKALANGASAMHWNKDKKLSDITSGLMNKIAPAAQPGITPDPNGADTPPPKSPVTDAISAGGTRNTSVQIQFKNMVESIIMNGTAPENMADFEKQLTSAMARILGMAQATA